MSGSQDELFEMLRVDMHEKVGRYFTGFVRAGLTGFLGRKRYESQQELYKQRNDYERSLLR